MTTTSITIRIERNELDQIDREWRGNMDYKNRTEYIRSKLGLKQENEV